ncbi:cysteine hydrolase family protein [Halobium salinum]|uniref:Cysteine hydrolase family protein n=1 Tax=Halobium salinum TaxID=1364940 RepID=A0ABD5PB73_9EURY|nr:isochorismatase family cysteine hydrolase [Halobium salinum]
MEFDPETTALVVVDVQNGFCKPDGSLHSPASEDCIEPVSTLVDRAHDAGVRVVFTRDVHPPEQFEDAHYYDEFDRWGEHVVEGSWEAELVEELDVREGDGQGDDHVVEKHTYDAFHRTELEGWLNARGIRDLVICGTLANVCVLHTAGSAGLRDFKPVVVEDALGYIEEGHRDYAVEHSGWLFGETVSMDEVDFSG